jgi:hypothetical protein
VAAGQVNVTSEANERNGKGTHAIKVCTYIPTYVHE